MSVEQTKLTSVSKPYNKKAIIERINQITTTKERGVIVTRDGDKVVSRWKPSKRNIYELVDFKAAVAYILLRANKIFTPEFYEVVVKAGSQELKLRGKKHIINGETYYEMLWLTNSTNGTKVLSVRYGLMRQVCSNGMTRTIRGSSFKVKHLTANDVNKELKNFVNNLPTLNVNPLIKELKSLAKKTITVQKLADALVNQTGTKGNDTTWKQFVRKLATSQTDRLGTKQESLIVGISVPIDEMTKETLATELSSYQVLNCYTELWRSLDASQLERETDKILAILN